MGRKVLMTMIAGLLMLPVAWAQTNDCDAPLTLPYNQTFEGLWASNLPSCWLRIDPPDEDIFVAQTVWVTNFPHSGMRSMWLSTEYVDHNARVALPPFDTNEVSAEVIFYLINPYISTPTTLRVGLVADTLMTDTLVNATAFTVVYDPASGWQYCRAFIPIPADSNAWRLAFELADSASMVLIDDLHIESSTTCDQPHGLTLDWVTIDSAALSWQAGEASQWLLSVDGGEGVLLDTTAALLSGLTPASNIHVELRALCDAGDTTAPSVFDFRTLCVPWEVPYSESFNDYHDGDMPMCWDAHLGLVSNSVVAVQTVSDFESGWLRMEAYTGTSPVTAYSPALNADGNQLHVHFRARAEAYSNLHAGIVSAANYDDYVELLNVPIPSSDFSSNQGWAEYEFYTDTLNSAYLAQPLRVALTWPHWGELQIDDFHVDLGDSCHRPTAAWVDTSYNDSVFIGWEDYSLQPGGYEVRYSTYNALDSAEGAVFADAMPAIVDSLAPSMAYHFWVRALCPYDSARWTYAGIGFTDCGPLRLPHRENFNDYSSGLPHCWEALSGNWNILSGALYKNTHAGDTHIVVSPVIGVPGDEIFVSFTNTSYGGLNMQAGFFDDNDSVFIPILNIHEDGYHEFYSDSLDADDTVRLAFRVIGPTASYTSSVFIDDVLILNQRCRHPEGIRVDSVDYDMARVVITAPGSSGFYRLYLRHGDIVQTFETLDTIYDFTLLEAGTDYEVTVVGVCSDGSVSLSTSTTFRTFCSPIDGLDLPYVQDFDALPTGALNPDIECWHFIHYNSTHTLPGSGSSLSSPALAVSHTAAYSYTYLALPPVDNIGDIMLRFDARVRSSISNVATTIEIGFMTVPTDDLTFIPIDTVEFNIRDLWHSFERPLGIQYGRWPALRIKTASEAQVEIDNIWLGVTPDCSSTFSDFEVYNIWSYCADMRWSTSRAHNQNAEYVVHIIHPDGSAADDFYTHGDSLTACNLDELTTYLAWVELHCGGDLQAVSDTVSFTTRCDNLQSIEHSAYSHSASINANSGVPFTPLVRFSATQQLFTADELDALPSTITALDLRYRNDLVPLNAVSCSVYLSHTDSSELSQWQPDGLELVYSGPLTFLGNQWHTIYFNTPFEYNGTSNMLLTVVTEVMPLNNPTSMSAYNTHRPVVLRYQSSTVPFNDTLPVVVSYERAETRFHICPGELEICHTPVLTSVVTTSEDITMHYDASHHPCEVSISQGWIWNGQVEAVNTSGIYTFDSLHDNTVYIVGVRRICGNERSNWATRRLRTPMTVCPAASAPWADDVTASEATVMMHSDSAEMRQLHIFNFRLDTLITLTDTLCQLNGLVPSVTYRMSQRTFCGDDFELHSEWSDTTTFTTGYCHPVASASVRAVGLTAARVSWIDDSLGAAGRYRVEYGLRGYQRHEALGSYDVSGTECLIDSLDPSQMYDFYVATLCSDGTRSVWVYAGGVPPVGVEPVAGLSPQVTVYPNPASGSVTVDYLGDGTADFTLFDIGGRTVLSRHHLGAHQEIALGDLPAGAYFVRVTSAAGTSVGKLVIR